MLAEVARRLAGPSAAATSSPAGAATSPSSSSPRRTARVPARGGAAPRRGRGGADRGLESRSPSAGRTGRATRPTTCWPVPTARSTAPRTRAATPIVPLVPASARGPPRATGTAAGMRAHRSARSSPAPRPGASPLRPTTAASRSSSPAPRAVTEVASRPTPPVRVRRPRAGGRGLRPVRRRPPRSWGEAVGPRTDAVSRPLGTAYAPGPERPGRERLGRGPDSTCGVAPCPIGARTTRPRRAASRSRDGAGVVPRRKRVRRASRPSTASRSPAYPTAALCGSSAAWGGDGAPWGGIRLRRGAQVFAPARRRRRCARSWRRRLGGDRPRVPRSGRRRGWTTGRRDDGRYTAPR